MEPQMPSGSPSGAKLLLCRDEHCSQVFDQRRVVVWGRAWPCAWHLNKTTCLIAFNVFSSHCFCLPSVHFVFLTHAPPRFLVVWNTHFVIPTFFHGLSNSVQEEMFGIIWNYLCGIACALVMHSDSSYGVALVCLRYSSFPYMLKIVSMYAHIGCPIYSCMGIAGDERLHVLCFSCLTVWGCWDRIWGSVEVACFNLF